jgi:hypothetical protein
VAGVAPLAAEAVPAAGGRRSGFQAGGAAGTALATGGWSWWAARPRRLIARQLAEIGVEASVLLDPRPLDTAGHRRAAHGRASATPGHRGRPAADHHIPDPAAFRSACAPSLPAGGRAVTLA